MKYVNAIFMCLAAGASVAAGALSDNHLSQVETVNVAIAVFGAAAVYLAPITPDAQYVKWGLAALVAGLTAATTYIGAGGVQAITPSEYVQILAAAFAAVLAGARSMSAASQPPAAGRSGTLQKR